MQPRTRRRRLRAAMALTATLGLLGAACGDDDDDGLSGAPLTTSGDTAVTADPTTTPTTAASTDTTQPTTEPTTAPTTETTDETTDATADETADDTGDETANPAEFCQVTLDTQGAANSGPDVNFETATEEEIQEAMQEFSAQLDPVLQAFTENPPAELADAVETIDTSYRASLETGDDPFSDPAFLEAEREVDQWLADNCGYEMVSIRAVEYMFEDVPPSLESGVVGFEFENGGNEVHEMILFRINDDVDASVEELLELPEEESQEMARFVGAAFGAPGDTDMTFVDLEPGRYAMVCFIPIGTVDMEAMESEEEPGGPPHFTQGMHVEFEVT